MIRTTFPEHSAMIDALWHLRPQRNFKTRCLYCYSASFQQFNLSSAITTILQNMAAIAGDFVQLYHRSGFPTNNFAAYSNQSVMYIQQADYFDSTEQMQTWVSMISDFPYSVRNSDGTRLVFDTRLVVVSGITPPSQLNDRLWNRRLRKPILAALVGEDSVKQGGLLYTYATDYQFRQDFVTLTATYLASMIPGMPTLRSEQLHRPAPDYINLLCDEELPSSPETTYSEPRSPSLLLPEL
jgi:hypothetical protein